MTKSCKIQAMVNDESNINQGKQTAKPTRKAPIRTSNQMCASDNAWPVAHDAYEKLPGVPPGVSAIKPNGFSIKHIIKNNQNPAGFCSSQHEGIQWSHQSEALNQWAW